MNLLSLSYLTSFGHLVQIIGQQLEEIIHLTSDYSK